MMFDFSSTLFWYKIVFMLELIIAELIFIVNLRKRSHFTVRAVCSIAGLLLVAFLFPIVDYSAWWTCIMFAIMFFASLIGIKICFNESWWNIVFCGLAAYTVQHIAFVVSDSLQDLGNIMLGIEGQSNLYQPEQLSVSGAAVAVGIIMYLVSYVSIYLVAKYAYTDKIQPDEVSRLGRTKFVILAAVILLTDNIFNSVTLYNDKIDIISLWIERGYNILTCILGLQLQFSQLNEKEMQTKYDMVQQILREEQKQYMIVKQNLDTINIKCHDMKHQLRSMCEGGARIDKDEMEEIGRVLSIYESVVKTGNETLDLILAEKNLLYGDKKIQVTCIADGTLLNFMKPADMYSLFGNALDNSIEAVSELDESKRTIGLIIKRTQNMISVHIENYYKGERLLENGLPKTTKADDAYHGYGILSMRTITEKYNGTLAVEITDDVFSLNIMFPSRNKTA